MSRKHRLSASVDAGLVEAAAAACRRGRAQNLSAWVNDALRLKLEHEQRLEALASFIESYEAEYGEILPAEVDRATRRARARAVNVRGVAPDRSRAPSRRRKAS
jgi:hypothetical protein